MGEPGPLIGVGRSADVYDVGHGRVLRRYRDAAASAESEARIMERLAAQDYPVPAVFDASGPDLVMERLEGPTLLKSVSDRPWTLWSAGALLADLHLRLHRIDGTGLTDRQAGEGSAMLHLDLHPDNVMLTPRGPVVIDWSNAAVGDGAYDVAYVWMVMVIATIPGTGIDRVVNPIGRRILRTSFLRHFDRAQCAAAMVRLVEEGAVSMRNFDDVERERLRQLVDQLSALAPGG